MSIVETDKIDIVGVRPGSRIVRLVVTDHLPWDDYEAHANLLQDKLNAYLEFVESGELARMRTPPVPSSPDIHIVLVAQHRPSEPAEAFFVRIKEFLAPRGIAFDVDLSHASS